MSEKDISDGYAKLKFWLAVSVSAFLGLALTWFSSYLFIDVRRQPIAFIVILPIILGCLLGHIWYRGHDFQRKFGYRPWRKKPVESYENSLDYYDL
jgi:amino acid transporter